MPRKDPTRSLPNRLPRGEGSFAREYAAWLGDVARGFVPWVAYRIASKAGALRHGRHAGECRACLANVTWPIGDRLASCPNCGTADPCPEGPPAT